MKIIQKTIVKENFLFPSFFNRLIKDIESGTMDWYWEDKTIDWAEDDRHCMFATILFDYGFLNNFHYFLLSFWLVNIFIFFAIFKTSLLEVSFFIHIGTPPAKLWIL